MRPRSSVRRRPDRRPHGDDGTMAMYLIIAMVGLALGALMVPMIVTSARVTRSDTSRLHAIDAARAGLNRMLGQIRSATTDGVGSSTKLQCDPLSGTVYASGVSSYTVSVQYYMNDPITVPTTQPMRCVNGYGTFDPVSGAFTPRFARISSQGFDGTPSNGSTPGRTLISTYTFKTTNSNVVGGAIRIYPATGATISYCMDAGSAIPSAGTVLKLQTCAQPPTDQQVLAYRSDLTIQLLSSITASNTAGLCVDTAGPPGNGNSVVLNTCAAAGVTPPYTQQWSFNDNGQYEASLSTSATTTGDNLADKCIHAPSQNPGIALDLAKCDDNGSTGTTNPTQAWIPSPAVGAGAAPGAAGTQRQLVNYFEFGRCLDITNQQVSYNHMIDYPCKQNPNPAVLTFNQKFFAPTVVAGSTTATGPVYTTNGANYCLTSPGAAGGYVTFSVCVPGQSNQTWTVYGADSSLTYSAKYQIVDTGGRCLGLADPVTGEQWSAIDVEVCNGSTEQKWNASADLTASSLSGITEAQSGG